MMKYKLWHSAWLVVGIAVLIELFLLLSLVDNSQLEISLSAFVLLHGACAVAVAAAVLVLLRKTRNFVSARQLFSQELSLRKRQEISVFYPVFVLCVTLPGVGALGASLALFFGEKHARLRHRDPDYWQFTENAELPFTTPVGRPVKGLDSRSLREQVVFSTDKEALYNKVLAAGRIRASLSVETLKEAVRHSDERIRLTAYQTLDKKISALNRAIQQLEQEVKAREGDERSNTWLQIASNYWELLTLEQDEPVAKKQLLEKAAAAASYAIKISPDSRNAHFVLGRIALLQRNPALASKAFARSIELGMPREKAVPYLAEAAFDQRDFPAVRSLLKSIDPAFTRYPPLAQVAEYWT